LQVSKKPAQTRTIPSRNDVVRNQRKGAKRPGRKVETKQRQTGEDNNLRPLNSSISYWQQKHPLPLQCCSRKLCISGKIPSTLRFLCFLL
jgi:hypothetical protein